MLEGIKRGDIKEGLIGDVKDSNAWEAKQIATVANSNSMFLADDPIEGFKDKLSVSRKTAEQSPAAPQRPSVS